MIEVLKQMVEALEDVGVLTDREWQAVHKNKANELRQAIRERALYQVQRLGQEIEQEPVATVTSETGADITMSWWHEPALPIGTKLYTHPPQRTWQGLTNEEREKHRDDWHSNIHDKEFKAIEAKLKQKNGFAEEKNND